MEDIFSQMLSFVDSEINAKIAPEDAYNSEIEKITKDIMKIEAPIIVAEKPIVEVYEFDASNNLLDPEVLQKFAHEKFPPMKALTEPIPTTCTMEGYLTNILFHESQLIEHVIADEDVVLIKCNYGKSVYEGYTEPTRVKTSNRGRKRKEKKRKQRKVQGNGTDFNSQISFHVRSSNDTISEYQDEVLIISPLVNIYKFKVFRNGVIQLPGVRPDIIDDVFNCANKLVTYLNFALHAFDKDPSKMSTIINLNPVMKNYKFAVITDGKMLDLTKLKQILLSERSAQIEGKVSPAPGTFIFDAKYNRSDTKLSIEFSTPIAKDKNKKTRVNIFMRGKVNILGAFETESTSNIALFLSKIFEENPSLVV